MIPAGRDQQHLRAHRQALAHDIAQFGSLRDQIGQLRSAQPQRQVAGIDPGYHRQHRDIGCRGRGRGRAGDAQPGKRADARDQQRVQRDVEHDRQDHELERRLRIARSAQAHAQHDRDHRGRHGDEDHAQIGQREMIGFAGRGHRAQQRGREYPAGRGDEQREPQAEPDPLCRRCAVPRRCSARRTPGRPLPSPPCRSRTPRRRPGTSPRWRWPLPPTRFRPAAARPRPN